MENKAFKKILNLYTSLLELHGENPFKIRNLSGKIFNLDKLGIRLNDESVETLEEHAGVGKKIAAAIGSIRESGSFPELDEMLSKTPEGVVQMLEIKGIGAKKVGTIWKELGVETIDDLYKAGQEGIIAKLPGFGEKTQKIILDGLDYKKEQEGKGLYAEWETLAVEMEERLSSKFKAKTLGRIGPLALQEDILESLDWLVDKDSFDTLKQGLPKEKELSIDEKNSGPFVIRGKIMENVPFSIKTASSEDFGNAELRLSSPSDFLGTEIKSGLSVSAALRENEFKSSKDFFSKMAIPEIDPPLRCIENILLDPDQIDLLVKDADLKGVLHAHSTYSDGQNSIEEMGKACIERGYEYFGLSDHSKSAFYANGLDEDRIIQQHQEIDEINKKLDPFRIFKGIESDILNDGSLDYDEEVLASFDFIVASVHSNLNMDERRATARLLNAIENPYTTMLGHPTGRLLLRREGYPINHKLVIDACASNNVIIEINANPWRLDIDWKWISYAQEKGVLIAINPDAHVITGIDDMRFGVITGRKGGLKKENTFNALPLKEVEQYFNKRKP